MVKPGDDFKSLGLLDVLFGTKIVGRNARIYFQAKEEPETALRALIFKALSKVDAKNNGSTWRS